MCNVEIETKYDASKFTFVQVCKLLGFDMADTLGKSQTSYNHYFTRGGDFVRLRDLGQSMELTTKKDTGSQYEREEVNLTLFRECNDYNDVEKFLCMLGFEHDFTAIKHTNTLVVGGCIITHEVVEANNTRHTFLEIESLQGVTSEEAWERIETVEKKLSSLGVTPENRLQTSIYSLFSTRK